MKKTIFKGVATALVTPFKNGEVDFDAYEILFKKQLSAQVDAVVILGTTGEPCTLCQKEKQHIIKLAVNILKNKTKIIVGCGSNNTKSAKENYIMAEKYGADAALIVTPYYNKCTQDGCLEYYKEISTCGKMPIIVYNVPSRTGFNIMPDTMAKLCEIENICGIKEASGNISQILELFYKVGEKVDIYSGDDSLNTVFYNLGASGTISVLSNIAPKLCKKIYKLCENKNFEEAKNVQLKLLPLINALFLEVNPIPIKAALNHLGLCENELRSPLTPISQQNLNNLIFEINKLVQNNDCL